MSKKSVSRLLEEELEKRARQRIERLRANGMTSFFSDAEQAELNRLIESNPTDPQKALAYATKTSLVKQTEQARDDTQSILAAHFERSAETLGLRLHCSAATYARARLAEALDGERWAGVESILWALEEGGVEPPAAVREWSVGALADGAFVLRHSASAEGDAWRKLVDAKMRELSEMRLFDELASGTFGALPPQARTEQTLREISEAIANVHFGPRAPQSALACVRLDTLEVSLARAERIEMSQNGADWAPIDAKQAVQALKKLSERAQLGQAAVESLLGRALSPQLRLENALARWGLADEESLRSLD
jgi:hypothetical protein